MTLRSLVFIVPGRLETRTGGYEYDRRMIGGLRDRGWAVDVRELDDSFPQPTTSALAEADRVLAAIPDGTLVAIDGLACSAMPAPIERHAARLSIVPVVHALIASEVGIDSATARQRAGGERRALSPAALIIVPGVALLEPLARYGIGRDRIEVVTPGTVRAPLARGSGDSGVLHLVTVATLNPGKGHDILFHALSRLTDRRWRLTCAGSAERHPETAARLRSTLTALQLDDRVTLAGELDTSGIAALYHSADAFVLATLSETHALVVGEALARGLPVVSTLTGAIPDLVGRGDDAAGVLVAPGDVEALADALANVIDDTCLRARLAENARRVRERLRTWEDAARYMDSLMVSLSNHERGAHLSAVAEDSGGPPKREARRPVDRLRMSVFPSLADWLTLREPIDAASRSAALTRAVADALPHERPLQIVDLGCGTGSNVRYLTRHLPGAHEWLLVDKDPSVLALAPHETRQLDLGARNAPDIFARRDLVTASALLDLVSAEFLTWLAERCRENGAAALFALTYTGRATCNPPEPEDGVVCALLSFHQQQSDKGFGPAAGPGAVACAEKAFTDAGFRVRREPSDWHIEPDARELQQVLIQGWADAALEMAPFEAEAIADWHARRLAHLHAGRSRIVVAHEDLAAFPGSAQLE